MLTLPTDPPRLCRSPTAFVSLPAAGCWSPASPPPSASPLASASCFTRTLVTSFPLQISFPRSLFFHFPCPQPQTLVIVIQAISAVKAEVEMLCSGRRCLSCWSSVGQAHPVLLLLPAVVHNRPLGSSSTICRI